MLLWQINKNATLVINELETQRAPFQAHNPKVVGSSPALATNKESIGTRVIARFL